MASRNSFLDAPSFRRITSPQRGAIERRRSRRGVGGSGTPDDPIRQLTEEEIRQNRLEQLQKDLSDTGTKLTKQERQAILSGKSVSEVRQQITQRQRKSSLTRLQRDLSRTGTKLTEEQSQAILSGTPVSQVRQQVARQQDVQLARQRGQRGQASTVTTPSGVQIVARQTTPGGEVTFQRAGQEQQEFIIDRSNLFKEGRRPVLTSEKQFPTRPSVVSEGRQEFVPVGARTLTPRLEATDESFRETFSQQIQRTPEQRARRQGFSESTIQAQQAYRERQARSAERQRRAISRLSPEGSGPLRQATAELAVGAGVGVGEFAAGLGERAFLFGRELGESPRAATTRAGLGIAAFASGVGSALNPTRPIGRARLGVLAAPSALSAAGALSRATPQFGTLSAASRTTPLRAAQTQITRAISTRPSTSALGSIRGIDPGFGALTLTSRRSPVQAAGTQIRSALETPTSRGFGLRQTSIRPGAVAETTSISGRGRVRTQLIREGTTSFAVPGTGLRQETLTFGPGTLGERARAFPRVTQEAAEQVIRGPSPAEPITVTPREFARIRTPRGFERGLPDFLPSLRQQRTTRGFRTRPEPGTSQFGIEPLVTERGRVFGPLSRQTTRRTPESVRRAIGGFDQQPVSTRVRIPQRELFGGSRRAQRAITRQETGFDSGPISALREGRISRARAPSTTIRRSGFTPRSIGGVRSIASTGILTQQSADSRSLLRPLSSQRVDLTPIQRPLSSQRPLIRERQLQAQEQLVSQQTSLLQRTSPRPFPRNVTRFTRPSRTPEAPKPRRFRSFDLEPEDDPFQPSTDKKRPDQEFRFESSLVGIELGKRETDKKATGFTGIEIRGI